MTWDRVTVVVDPADVPVTIEEVRDWSRIDEDCDDLLLEDMIRGAASEIDGPAGIGYGLIEQTWRLSLDEFPCDYRETVELPGAPIKSVTSINYVDVDGVNQVVAPADYDVDTAGDNVRIEPAYGLNWPATRDRIGAVWIDYVLGESDAMNIPQDLRQALMLIVSHRYENREAVSPVQLNPIPMGVESILNRYRRTYVA